MIFVYEKGTNKFIGMAPAFMDNGVEREFKLEELYPSGKNYGFFYTKDSPKFAVSPNNWQWVLDKEGNPVGIERRPRLTIALSTSAQDKDGDGSYELMVRVSEQLTPENEATIEVQLMDGQKEAKQEVEVKLSTTAGILTTRTLMTDKRGRAKTKILAGPDTIAITVTAAGEGMDGSMLDYEVLWVDEYRRLYTA